MQSGPVGLTKPMTSSSGGPSVERQTSSTCAAYLTHNGFLRRRRGERRTELRWRTSVGRSKPSRMFCSTFTRSRTLPSDILPSAWHVRGLTFSLSPTFISTQLVGGEGDVGGCGNTSCSPLQARSPLRNATLTAVQSALSKHQQQTQVSAASSLVADVSISDSRLDCGSTQRPHTKSKRSQIRTHVFKIASMLCNNPLHQGFLAILGASVPSVNS